MQKISAFWNKRKSWQKGSLIGALLLFLGLIYLISSTALGYRGQCGGLFPFLAGSRDCSFFEYFKGNLFFGLAIILYEFWWAVLLVIFIPAFIGYLINKKRVK